MALHPLQEIQEYIKTDSVLSGQKLTLKNFVQLLFCFSIKELAGISILQLTGLSENTVSDWKIFINTRIADWLVANPCPLGGPGVVDPASIHRRGRRVVQVAPRTGHGAL